MVNYYVWLNESNGIVIAKKSDMVPTGDAHEYEMETSQPYIDKKSTLIKVYGVGSKPIYAQEIMNSDLNPNLHNFNQMIVFDKPTVNNAYKELYQNLLKILKTPKFVAIRAKKKVVNKAKRCKCNKSK